MRNASRKPPKPAGPQLLALPERVRIESAFRKACNYPNIDLIGIELERNPSLTHGEIIELVVFARRPNGKSLNVRHLLRDGTERNIQALLGAAEIAGQTIGRVLNAGQ